MSTAPHTAALDAAESIAPIVAEKFSTPEDLLAMPDGKAYELVNGKLVERKMGAESSRIVQIINARVEIHADNNRLGLSWGADCSYRIFGKDAATVRRPDGSFIAKGRLPNDLPPQGHIEIFPDLVIEVVSPHDLAAEVDNKVEEYLQAGVRLIWVVYPESKHVLVYRAGSTVQRLGIEEELSGEDVLPEFRLAISKIFPVASEPVASEEANE